MATIATYGNYSNLFQVCRKRRSKQWVIEMMIRRNMSLISLISLTGVSLSWLDLFFVKISNIFKHVLSCSIFKIKRKCILLANKFRIRSGLFDIILLYFVPPWTQRFLTMLLKKPWSLSISFFSVLILSFNDGKTSSFWISVLKKRGLWDFHITYTKVSCFFV